MKLSHRQRLALDQKCSRYVETLATFFEEVGIRTEQTEKRMKDLREWLILRREYVEKRVGLIEALQRQHGNTLKSENISAVVENELD